MLKVKRFRVDACMPIDSVEGNIEGDATLHQPPVKLSVKVFKAQLHTLTLFFSLKQN